MISIDTKNTKRLERQLLTLSREAFPKAVSRTLNTLAFATQKNIKKITKDKFVLKNNYTITGMQVTMSNPQMEISSMQSEVGSVRKYMGVQESGGTKNKKSKRGTPILTAEGAGQPRGTRPRTKLSTRQHRFQNLQLFKGFNNPGKTSRQKVAIAIAIAIQKKRRYLFLESTRRQGIYRVTGTRKNPHTTLIWNLTFPSVKIPKREWMRPGLSLLTQAEIQKFYNRSLRSEIRQGNQRI